MFEVIKKALQYFRNSHDLRQERNHPDKPEGKRLETFVAGYSDSAFTNVHTVISPNKPIDGNKIMTPRGYLAEGWETRRLGAWSTSADRTVIFNPKFCHTLELGLMKRAEISGFNFDTRYFTGNQIPAVSVIIEDAVTGKEKKLVIDKHSLNPNSHNYVKLNEIVTATAIRVEGHSEGGISRVRVFGKEAAEQPTRTENILRNATVLGCSDTHYGNPEQTFFATRNVDITQGWQTARSGRGEYVLVALQEPSAVSSVVVDTYLHEFNSFQNVAVYGLPEECEADSDLDDLMSDAPDYTIKFHNGDIHKTKDLATFMDSDEFEVRAGGQDVAIRTDLPENSRWVEILPITPIANDAFNHISSSANPKQKFSHLFIAPGPHGGLHGLKVFSDKCLVPTPDM